VSNAEKATPKLKTKVTNLASILSAMDLEVASLLKNCSTKITPYVAMPQILTNNLLKT
tara:strand:- start:340 stop:513 length:174 start_codon:yes stop_codon:yes gene_type:complete